MQRFDAVARAIDVDGLMRSQEFDEQAADGVVILDDQNVSIAHGSSGPFVA
jgi:hypothetical protein